jgi:hypothetical protein
VTAEQPVPHIPDAPPPRRATRLVDGLPLSVLQVREGRDHGGGHRCRDTPRRAYPVTPGNRCLPVLGTATGVQSMPAQPKLGSRGREYTGNRRPFASATRVVPVGYRGAH